MVIYLNMNGRKILIERFAYLWFLLARSAPNNFWYIKKYRYGLYFNTKFLILLTFLGESLKVVLINTVAILITWVKWATLRLLKTKVFWNKGYNVMIFFHDVINKILSRDSNYIVDSVMWPKFGNSSISMREVIITSIL